MQNIQKNIIFIFADQWRGTADTQQCHTPSLNQFKQAGIDCTHAISGCSQCSPYRASLLTGLYPLRHGVLVNDATLSPQQRQSHRFSKHTDTRRLTSANGMCMVHQQVVSYAAMHRFQKSTAWVLTIGKAMNAITTTTIRHTFSTTIQPSTSGKVMTPWHKHGKHAN